MPLHGESLSHHPVCYSIAKGEWQQWLITVKRHIGPFLNSFVRPNNPLSVSGIFLKPKPGKKLIKSYNIFCQYIIEPFKNHVVELSSIISNSKSLKPWVFFFLIKSNFVDLCSRLMRSFITVIRTDYCTIPFLCSSLFALTLLT